MSIDSLEDRIKGFLENTIKMFADFDDGNIDGDEQVDTSVWIELRKTSDDDEVIWGRFKNFVQENMAYGGDDIDMLHEEYGKSLFIHLLRNISDKSSEDIPGHYTMIIADGRNFFLTLPMLP